MQGPNRKDARTDAPGSDGHAGMEMESTSTDGMESMGSSVTRPQLLSVTLLTLLALAGGVLVSAAYNNLGVSAEEVGGAIMPPGMVDTRDTPAEAMREMAAVDPGEVDYEAPEGARGDRTLEPRIAEDGTKVFDLNVSVIEWNILPYEQVMAYAFNRQVPGPRIRITEGDRVRINVQNDLPESTTVHWHGLILPNKMDGPADITQEPIEPGESFAYEFTANQAGTFFYHSHDGPDRQQGLGMYGALIIDPKKEPESMPAYDKEAVVQLQEWTERNGYTFPSMIMEGALPNFFTINGKSYPSTETIKMKVGEKLRVRFIGSNNNFVHPMHIHGGPFEIVATDGEPVPESAQIEKDTVNVGPGERYDVIWTAREPGKWLLHCHIPHHTTNDNVEEKGGGGLTQIINVTE
jgi:FtsP/CotA-like multicopper oxidase with cupredoxin domain